MNLLLGHRLRERLRGHCVIVIAVLALRPDLRRELLLAHLGHAAQAGALHGFVLDRQLLVAPLVLLVAHAHAEGDERHNDADGGGNHDDLLVGRLFGFQPAVGGVDEKHVLVLRRRGWGGGAGGRAGAPWARQASLCERMHERMRSRAESAGSTLTSLNTEIFIARILSSTEGSSAWPLKRKQKS